MQSVTHAIAPRGFFWVREGRLGGMRRPGIFNDVRRDLAHLRALGINVLITLEETLDFRCRLAPAGLASVHLPVPPDGVPGMVRAVRLLSAVARRLSAGDNVVFHCLAGSGRSPLLLAGQLIWGGETAARAEVLVRDASPSWFPGDAHVRFLKDLEAVKVLLRGS